MANINEEARSSVFVDGKQAGQELQALTKLADGYKNAMIKANKAGDVKAFKKAETDLKRVNKQTSQLKKENFNVAKILKNINGASYNDLNKALKQTNKELRKMKRNDPGFKQKSAEAKKLKTELDKARKSMGGFNQRTSMFKKLLPWISVGILVNAVKRLGSELFKLSKQIQGEAIRAAVVFGVELGFVEEQAKSLAKQMGVTNREFVAMSAETADLLIPLDFTRKASAQMAVELQGLTGALDEWTAGQIGAREISQILTKAMLGENEQLKRLGIAIRKDTDEYRDLVKQKLETNNVTKAQAEAMATLELIQKKSTDAQTAYTKEGNKLLRFEKELGRRWRQKKEDIIGWFDIPTAQKLRDEQVEVNSLTIKLQNANLKEETRLQLLERLNTIAPDVAKAIRDENTELEELQKTVALYNKQMALKILIAEEEVKNAKKKKTVAKFLELHAEAEADLLKEINASLEWFKKKGPEYTDQINKVLFDDKLEIVQKGERINALALQATKTGNARLFSALNSFKIFRQRYHEESDNLEQLILQSDELIKNFEKISGAGTQKTSPLGPPPVDYKTLLSELEIFHAERMLKIKEQFAAELITKDEFDAQRLSQELIYLTAKNDLEQQTESKNADKTYQLLLDKQIEFNKKLRENNDENNLESLTKYEEQLQKEFDLIIDQDMKLADEQLAAIDIEIEAEQDKNLELDKLRIDEFEKSKKNIEDKINLTAGYAAAVGSILGEAIVNGELSLKEASKQILLVTLQTLKNIVTSSIISATVQSLSTPDSIATFGISGLIRAGVLVGLIETAYAGVSSLLTSKSGFKTGGYTGAGSKHDAKGVVHANEYVVASDELNNPDIAPFIWNVVEPKRTARLNTGAVSYSPGFVNGGPTSSTNQTQTFDNTQYIDAIERQNELLERNAELMVALIEKPLEVPWYGEGGINEKMNEAGSFEEDVNA